MPRMSTLWLDLKAGLWFVPLVIGLAAVALALGLVAVDARFDAGLDAALPWIAVRDTGAATNMLTVIAGSMVTVAALVFSLTIIALTLASTQFSPRILRTFMRNRITQSVLGFYVGVFVYCIVVLRTIHGDTGEGAFVPSLAVAGGAVLGMASMGVLVAFMHHIARSIAASNIIAGIAAETRAVIDELCPVDVDPAAPAAYDAAPDGPGWERIDAQQTGYVRSVDVDGLADAARASGATIRLERRVGEFVVEGSQLASVRGASAAAVARAVGDCCHVDAERTIEQDVAFGLRQLVDISLKALSAAVNDTTTALTCVDHIGAIAARLAGRRVGPMVRRDTGGLRVYVPGQSLEDLLDLSFNQIRQNAGGNVAVMIRLLGAIETVIGAGGARTTEGAEILASQIRGIAELAERTVHSPDDRAAVVRRAAAIESRFSGSRKS